LRAAELTEDRPELAAAVTPLLNARLAIEQSLGHSAAKRRGLRKAKVAVARKLAVIPHRMWN
jgi:hypothetical protein